jgi:dTDP-4-dehydrorhamnose 3,5-epimerase
VEVVSLPLSGLKLVRLDVFVDERGFFLERFNERRFEETGLPAAFCQDNHSHSLPGVLRGLHYQMTPPQGKLVGVISGRILDVAVDIRPESDTFGQHASTVLSAGDGRLLWIPAGFAHGFFVLGAEPADVIYKVDHPYNPRSESGILWSDPDLEIEWPTARPIVSQRDLNLPSFAEYCQALSRTAVLAAR